MNSKPPVSGKVPVCPAALTLGVSLLTVPTVFGLLVLHRSQKWGVQCGKMSEQLLQGQRLPNLTNPATNSRE